MASYLVTGGAGFIGSHIVEALLSLRHEVRVLDNFSTGQRDNLNDLDTAEVIDGDVRSYHIVRAVMDGIDVVLHQAALPSVPRSVHDPITSNDVNVTGTLNVLTAARDTGVGRLVLASSSSVSCPRPTTGRTSWPGPATSRRASSCISPSRSPAAGSGCASRSSWAT